MVSVKANCFCFLAFTKMEPKLSGTLHEGNLTQYSKWLWEIITTSLFLYASKYAFLFLLFWIDFLVLVLNFVLTWNYHYPFYKFSWIDYSFNSQNTMTLSTLIFFPCASTTVGYLKAFLHLLFVGQT